MHQFLSLPVRIFGTEWWLMLGLVVSLSCSCCVTLHAVGPLIDPSP